MKRLPLIASMALLMLLHACGKSQHTEENAGRDTLSSSKPDATMSQSQRQNLLALLDQVRRTLVASKDTIEADRIINASYASFQVMTALARAWDGDGALEEAIDGRHRTFVREDSLRKRQDGKIINGVLGMHEMAQLLYSMRYAGDSERMALLDTMEQKIRKLSTARVQGMEFVAQLADDLFLLLKETFLSLDRENSYAGHFEQITQVYAEGTAAAQTDEDRFLNGIYRSFEVCQIWAQWLEPQKRGEIKELYQDLIGETTRREGVGHQMATGMEFLYKALDRIAAATIATAP